MRSLQIPIISPSFSLLVRRVIVTIPRGRGRRGCYSYGGFGLWRMAGSVAKAREHLTSSLSLRLSRHFCCTAVYHSNRCSHFLSHTLNFRVQTKLPTHTMAYAHREHHCPSPTPLYYPDILSWHFQSNQLHKSRTKECVRMMHMQVENRDILLIHYSLQTLFWSIKFRPNQLSEGSVLDSTSTLVSGGLLLILHCHDSS
jgi:hypothetical protein